MDRSFELLAGGRVITTPCFFPSISSIKTNLLPVHYLDFLVSIGWSHFLVSAYDIDHAGREDRLAIDEMLTKAYEERTIVLLDSGNYESYWRGDAGWDIERFEAICRTLPLHLIFCFDNQDPGTSAREIAEDVLARVGRTCEVFPRGTVLPIIHGPKDQLPDIAGLLAEQMHPIMVAVPERELGDGILERAQTTSRLRAALNRAGYYCHLHLLGTGSPLSILVYAKCGADSFDGLEWCQTCVDHKTAVLHHFHQLDFFSDQAVHNPCLDLPYEERALLHNLVFYGNWLREISNQLRGGHWGEFASKYLPQGFLVQVMNLLSRC